MGTLSEHPINGWRERFKLKAFVETGIGAGDGVMQAAKNGYDRIISIEASPAMALIAIHRISAEMPGRSFSVMIGPSPGQLKWIVSELREPTLFWLDAHIPKYYGHDIGDDFPLLDEVTVLSHRERFRDDVVIADDLAMYGVDTDDKFPEEVCLRPAPSYVFDKTLMILGETHNVTINRGGYGHLVALPR